MNASERLSAEARQARLIADNVQESRYKLMLTALADRLEREAAIAGTAGLGGGPGCAAARPEPGG